MLICPHHKEYETIMLQTLAFQEKEVWCPYCGHTTGMPVGDYENKKDTPALQEMFIIYKHYTQQYLYAMSTRNGYKVEYEGKHYKPEDLPEEEKERIQGLIDGWKYGVKLDSIRRGEVYGMEYEEIPPKHCFKCDKKITDNKGNDLIGLSFKFHFTENATDEIKEFTKKQWGKYFTAGSQGVYICLECYIDAMLGKK